MTLRSIHLATGCLLFCAFVFSGVAAAATSFSNATPITINDNTAASVYPSSIVVTGLTGTVTGINVTLNGFSHTFSGDLNLLLVAPGGQKIMLSQRTGGGRNFSNATITFSASTMRNFNTVGDPIPSGVYHPFSTSSTNSYAPAPAGPYSTDLTVFNGPAAAQNGIWNLYVSDHAGADVGTITGGWTLTVNPPSICAAAGFFGGKLTLCHQVCEVAHPTSTTNALIKVWIAAYRSDPPCI